jgi:serine/threonine-protein kinase
VDGPDLGALVRARGPLPVAEACEFVRQIAAGLQHAHEKGMVHRDLKPANLLVARPTASAPMTVKIADFGLPKASAAAGEFAAPELLGTKAKTATAVDHRADLYSLGRVFHFLLTGQAGGEPLPLVQVRPDVPPDVAAIVHRLLAKNPDARFASAAELLRSLGSACVPLALPVDGAVNFDLSVPPVRHDRDSEGYLTGGKAGPSASAASPWAEITARTERDAETPPPRRDETPTPLPRKVKAPGHGEPVPLWMTAALLVGMVLMCVLGILVAVKLFAK